MNKYELIKTMSIDGMVTEIVGLVCESHCDEDDDYLCLKCSHWDKVYGGCRAKSNIKKALESEAESNDIL